MDRVLKKSFDVSSFLLVEATGDSEVDSDPNMAIVDHLAAADDDAESCSCDTSDHSCVSDFINGTCSEVGTYDRANYNVVEEEEEEEQEQETGVHVYQSWVDHGHVGLPAKHKSCVSVDSTNESMNEKEKNRMFWEACLAS